MASSDSRSWLLALSERPELVEGRSRRLLRRAFGVSLVERSGCPCSPSESKCVCPILWLDFVYETADQPKLESVQLIECDTPQCNQPTLLHQHGTCDSEVVWI